MSLLKVASYNLEAPTRSEPRLVLLNVVLNLDKSYYDFGFKCLNYVFIYYLNFSPTLLRLPSVLVAVASII